MFGSMSKSHIVSVVLILLLYSLPLRSKSSVSFRRASKTSLFSQAPPSYTTSMLSPCHHHEFISKLLQWIMGLGALQTAWQRQTRHFSHTAPHNTTYRCLIFDNRGMGASAKPTLRYTTSEMALDTLDLLDALCWTQPRQLHVIGVSMGGMIAQELALLIPERIASLVLVSTAARLENTAGFVENLRQRINLFIPRGIDAQLAEVKPRIFSQGFLDAPDEDGGFPTNGDRFAAQELSKRTDKVAFTKKGFVLQAVAAGWHFKSAKQLKEMADRVGRERTCVMHGTADRMITFHHAEVLRRELGEGVRFERFDGKGHVLLWEEKDAFNRVVEEMVEKGRMLPS
jgi:pimeloyl-ACP methyl ester carboxylesterase